MSAGRSRLTGHGAERAIILPRYRAPRARRAAGSPGARPAAISGLWVTTRIVGPAAVQLGQQGEDARAGRRVQAAGRLVGQDDGGPPGQRPGDGDALALAAGQFGGTVAGPAGQADLGQRVGRGRGGAARAGIPRYSSPVATLSSAVSVGTRKNCWNTNPIRSARTPDSAWSGSPSTASPATRTLPAVGRPGAGDGQHRRLARTGRPTIAVNSPVPIVTLTDRSAATGGDPGCSLDTPMSSRALAGLFTGPPPPSSRPRCPPR